MGNIHSVVSALNYLGYSSEYTNNLDVIENANRIILPGVGSFRIAMDSIAKLGLEEILLEYALNKRRPILGICLGMQLMGNYSTEGGKTQGLGLFDGNVEGFKTDLSIKVPHIGFNNIGAPANSVLYKDVQEEPDFYFVHSYRMLTSESKGVAYCTYGERFVASYEKENVFGTQFHPEKSQKNGLKLLDNFMKL